MTASRTAKAWKNHKDRPEIAAALKNGRGESVRTSRTLAEQTYYYAARLDDGSVIRVASTTKSALATVVHTIPVMIAMGILIVVGVLILAEFQTKRIVAPVNEMDPDDQRPVKSTMNWPHWYADWKSRTKPSGSRWNPCGKSRKNLPPLPRICGKDLLW